MAATTSGTVRETRGTQGRVGVYDVVRGFSVVSMVLFHYCYDLRFLAGADLAWFAPPLQDVWRASISWTFLFVAGCMCSMSRSNLRRACRYGLAALAIWVVTVVASVDVPISFGIIYCMAACTLVAWLLGRLGALPRGPMAALVLLVAFVVLLPLPQGRLGVGSLMVRLPSALYSTDWLSWLGLPGPHFASGDYYPLLPYLMMYLVGVSMGRWWGPRGYPAWARHTPAALRPLAFVGRHALPVYLLHQPVLLVLSGAVAL